MHTTVTLQQINHFKEFGWIEFEGFLPAEHCARLSDAIRQSVAKRLKTDGGKLFSYDQPSLYAAARDSWRISPVLKQAIQSQRFVSTAASLANKEPLLLACDQWIPSGTPFEPLNLQAHFSFQNLVCGCLLLLEGEQAGNARFCHPDRLPLFESGPQLLVAYGTTNTVYVHNSADPANASLKSFGYSFGDRLKPQHHPICKTGL